MTKKSGGQGQSYATVEKSRGISKALDITTRIVKATYNKYPRFKRMYWHCDLNAGSGWNHDVDTAGSPFLFLQFAQHNLLDIPWSAIFCESNKGRNSLLHELLQDKFCAVPYSHDIYSVGDNGKFAIVEDNENALDRLARGIRKQGFSPDYALGSIILDPNGYFGRNKKNEGVPPEENVFRFTRGHNKIDVICNLNITSFYRVRGTKKPDCSCGEIMPDYEDPDVVLERMKKSSWWIRHTDGKARDGYGRTDQFMLAIGRNIESGMSKKDGFVPLWETVGQDLMRAICKRAEDDLANESRTFEAAE